MPDKDGIIKVSYESKRWSRRFRRIRMGGGRAEKEEEEEDRRDDEEKTIFVFDDLFIVV